MVTFQIGIEIGKKGREGKGNKEEEEVGVGEGEGDSRIFIKDLSYKT